MAQGTQSSMAQSSSYASLRANRWLQLAIGVTCMVMIANLQYGWTLFVGPLDVKYHWERAAIQVAFTIFILTETWLVPFEGYLVDRFGPTPVVMVSGILVGVAWVINSVADSLTVLYIGAALGGIGAGAVYGTCVGHALKWFADRRGLAAGLSAAGCRGIDGDRAVGAHCQGLQDCRYSSEPDRHNASRTHFRALDRPGAERAHPALLWLGVRSYRA